MVCDFLSVLSLYCEKKPDREIPVRLFLLVHISECRRGVIAVRGANSHIFIVCGIFLLAGGGRELIRKKGDGCGKANSKTTAVL